MRAKQDSGSEHEIDIGNERSSAQIPGVLRCFSCLQLHKESPFFGVGTLWLMIESFLEMTYGEFIRSFTHLPLVPSASVPSVVLNNKIDLQSSTE